MCNSLSRGHFDFSTSLAILFCMAKQIYACIRVKMSKSVCKRYRRSIVRSRCYTSKDVSSIHSTTWKCCVPNVGRCTDSSNYLPIDQRGTNLYFLQHHVLLSVFKTDVGGRIFLQLKNATIYLLVCLFVFFGFLFSTTNVCENTDQHRGVCQRSTGVV